jgi:peptidoglycan/LPS O-acetylase OafA/YrhL
MAWWVVIGHGLQLFGVFTGADFNYIFNLTGHFATFSEKVVPILLQGGSAVKVFIILSGFVICHLITIKQESFKFYILRRYFRLAPTLLVCIAIAIAVEPLYILSYIDLGFITDSEMRIARLSEQSANFWLHLLSHIGLAHSIIPQEILPYASGTFLAPAWSIGLEWQFYLLAPFLVVYIGKSQNNMLLVTTLFLVITFVIWRQSFFEWKHGSFFFQVPHYFLVGILSRITLTKMQQKKMPVDILLLISCLLFIQDPLSSLIWLVFFGITCYEAGFIKIESKSAIKVLNIFVFSHFITNLGRYSYSTYLVHIPVFSFLVGTYTYLVGVNNVTQLDVAMILLFSVPVIFFLSSFLFRYVEMPPMKFIKSYIKARS